MFFCKKTLCFLLFCFFHATLFAKCLKDLYPVDFIKDMQCSKIFDVAFAEKNTSWILCKQLYDTCMATQYDDHEKTYIPETFHLIWLGSAVPQGYFELQDQIKKFHPHATVKLWTDQEAKTYPMINRIAFDQSINYGEKSDIWRYEILYNEGGVYLDGDFEMLQSLQPLLMAS